MWIYDDHFYVCNIFISISIEIILLWITEVNRIESWWVLVLENVQFSRFISCHVVTEHLHTYSAHFQNWWQGISGLLLVTCYVVKWEFDKTYSHAAPTVHGDSDSIIANKQQSHAQITLFHDELFKHIWTCIWLK